MELKDNPLLQPEDYTAGYREQIDNLKNHPEYIEFDKLTYETFSTEVAKKWLEHIEKRFLLPGLINRDNPNYNSLLIWADGFKDFPRMILQHIRAHSQRIQAEGKV